MNRMSKPKTKEEFLAKHPPLTPEEVKKRLKEQKRAKDIYSKDMGEVEKNLLGYFEVLEPIADPETDQILAWMKVPSNMLLDEYYQLTGGETDPNKLSEEQIGKIKNKEYQMMVDFIMIPKRDLEWWKKHLNPRFSMLFRLKLESMFEELGVVAENFLEAKEDSA